MKKANNTVALHYVKSAMMFVLTMVIVACSINCNAFAEADNSTTAVPKQLEFINTEIQQRIQTRENTWSYYGTVEYDVIGTEVERVNGWSRYKNSSGEDLFHYSRARFECGPVHRSDTGKCWGYGVVYATTEWIDSGKNVLYTGKFYYGSE